MTGPDDRYARLVAAVEEQIAHAALNGHSLDPMCQGVSNDEIVPAVRVDYLRAALESVQPEAET